MAISSYLWSFGDGFYSSEPNPTHLYKNAGVYRVVLKVTDTLGNEFTATKTISVYEWGENLNVSRTNVSYRLGLNNIQMQYPTMLVDDDSNVSESNSVGVMGKKEIEDKIDALRKQLLGEAFSDKYTETGEV